jgi:hypothetical protein
MNRQKRKGIILPDMTEPFESKAKPEAVEALPVVSSAVSPMLVGEAPATPEFAPRAWLSLRIFLLSCTALVFVFLVGASVLLWILLNHSISNDQVRTQIEAQLSTLLGSDYSVVIGETRVALGENGLVSIDVNDVKILRDQVTNLGVARQIGVKIKPYPLLSGEVVAESVTMRGASIAVDAAFPTQETDQLRPVWPRSISLIKGLRRIGESMASLAFHMDSAGLETLALVDTNLIGFDQLGLRGNRAKLVSTTIRKVNKGGGSAVVFDALLKTQHSELSLEGGWARNQQGGMTFDFSAGGLTLKDVIDPAARGELLAGLDNRVSLTFSAPYLSDGTPQAAKATIHVGKGSIPIGKEHKAELMEAEFNFLLSPDINQLDLERSVIRFANTEATLVGGVRYPARGEDPVSMQPVFRLHVEKFEAFGLVDGIKPPIGQLLVEGIMDPLRQSVSADRIVMSTPNGEINGSARVLLDQSEPQIRFGFSTDSMPVEEFKQFWPAVLAPKARKWVKENLSGGQVNEFWIKADFPPGLFGKDVLYQPQNLTTRISVDNTAVNNPGDLPTITNASGVAEVFGNTSKVSISGGSAEIPGAGKLTLSHGSMDMGNYAIPQTPATLNLEFSGPAAAMAKLATLNPLSFTNRLGIEPGDISGSASAAVTAHFLIGQKMSLARKPWETRIETKDIRSAKPIEGRKLDQANLSILASPESAKITGSARLDGVPVKLDMVESLDGKSRSLSTVTISLSDKERQKLGLGTGGVVSGPIEATLTNLADGSQRVVANLTRAKLDFPWIGWSKGKGINATAGFILNRSGAKTSFSDIKLRGEGFSANGSFAMDRGGLLRADISKIVLNKIDDFDVKISRSGNSYAINLDARTYDARALIRSLLSDEAKPSKKSDLNVSVKGHVDRLIGFGNQSLNNVNVNFQRAGESVTRILVDALAAGDSPTRFDLGPVPGGMKVEISTSNAGSVLQFLDLYTKARGGTVKADLVRDESQIYKGLVVAEDFTLLNEPRLAQLLQKPQPPLDLENREELVRTLRRIKTDKAKVDQLQAVIEKGPKFLNISKGRLSGGDAAASFDGKVYDTNNRMNISGTFLPGRSLNLLVSKIPLIGLALGRGKVNGLLGITFRLRGRYNNPTLQVNPLSIIAPGVFRQLFKF